MRSHNATLTSPPLTGFDSEKIMNSDEILNEDLGDGSELNVQLCDSANYVKMTVLDISDDDALRFVQRVIESESTLQDREDAHKLITDIRTRIRKTQA